MLDFQKHAGQFREKDIALVAASSDTPDAARETVKKYGLSFPVLCRVEAAKLSERTGCFYNAQDGYVHATGFLLDPGGVVRTASYSSRALGRLTAKDSMNFIEYLRGKE